MIRPRASLSLPLATWLLLATVAVCSPARAAPVRGEASILYTLAAAPADSPFAAPPAFTPRTSQEKDQRLAAKLAELFSSVTSAADLTEQEKFVAWLNRNNLGLNFTVVRAPGTSPPTYRWNVSADLSVTATQLVVIVPTSAFAADEQLDLSFAEFAGRPSVAASPPLRDAPLLARARVVIAGTREAAPPARSADRARARVERIAFAAAVITQDAYARSQNPSSYRTDIETRLAAAVRAELPEGYNLAISFPTNRAGQPLPPDTLAVQITGLDPILSVAAAVAEYELPPASGGVLALAEFDTRFGSTRFGRAQREKIRTVEQRLADALAREPLLAALPDFIADERRDAIAERLTAVTGVTHASHSETHGVLAFGARYRPPQGSLVMALEGDSSRELTGSAAFVYGGWRNGDELSANAALGTTSDSASAAYTLPVPPLSRGANRVTAALAADYSRNRELRLGTFSGPLATMEEFSAGPRLTFERLPAANPLHFKASLAANYRVLRGSAASAAFLGVPRRLDGPALTARAEVQREFVSADKSRLTTKLAAETTQFFAAHRADYSRTKTDALVRRDFGGTAGRAAFVEARLAGGFAGDAAPRLDFFRLGGDTLRGLDEGELAGRSFAAAALEGGPALGTVIRKFSSGPGDPSQRQPDARAPSPLDQFYLLALLEQGWVSQQAKAGTDFNRHHRASSFGLGARYFGDMPGLAGGASIAFGYAWSHESLRGSGRFFTAVSITFGN